MEPTESNRLTSRINTEFLPKQKRNIAVFLVTLCVLFSWVGVIDNQSEEYVDSAIVQATLAYGGARALNAGISLLQSAEIDVVIASINPLEVLDPVNDMVEDYATVMKYSIASLLIQKLLVELLATSIFKWLITGAALLFISSLLFFDGLYSSPIFKGFLFITLIRFLFVLNIILCGLVDNTFVKDKTEAEMEKVSIATQALNRLEQNEEKLVDREREEINQNISEIVIKRDQLKKELGDNRLRAASANEELKNRKEELNHIGEDINFIFKPFSKNEKYLVAKQAVENANTNHSKILDKQELTEKQLKDVKEKLAVQYELLTGGKSFLSTMNTKIRAITDLGNVEFIKQKLNESIESMLNLIALFIFKTLIMPLVFLYAVIKTFRLLWGIDPRKLIKRQYSEMKTTLAESKK